MECRFRELRIQRGITQEEFRQDFNERFRRNYTPSAISLFENNKRIPEISALVDFADYFGVSLDYLLRRESSDGKEARPPQGERVSLREAALLHAYRSLSEAGKGIVDGMVDVVCRQESATNRDSHAYEKKEAS